MPAWAEGRKGNQEGSPPSGWPSSGTAPPVAGLAQKGPRTATACSDARLLQPSLARQCWYCLTLVRYLHCSRCASGLQTSAPGHQKPCSGHPSPWLLTPEDHIPVKRQGCHYTVALIQQSPRGKSVSRSWNPAVVAAECVLSLPFLKPSGQTQLPSQWHLGWAFPEKSRDASGEESLGSYPDKDGEEEVSAELLHPLGSHLPVIAVICLLLDGLFLHLEGRSGTCKGDE